MLLQLLFIVNARLSFVVGGLVCPVPVRAYIVLVIVVMVVVAAVHRPTVNMAVGIRLFGDSVSPTARQLAFHWLAAVSV